MKPWQGFKQIVLHRLKRDKGKAERSGCVQCEFRHWMLPFWLRLRSLQ